MAGTVLGRPCRQRTRARFLNAAKPCRVTRPSLGETHGRRSRTFASAREEFKGEGARCFGWDGLVKISPAAYLRATFESPGVRRRRHRTSSRARLSLGGTHGRRSTVLPVVSARKEFKGEGARCFARDGLGKVSLAEYACAIFERLGVGGCYRRTSARRTAVAGRDPRPALSGDVSCEERV